MRVKSSPREQHGETNKREARGVELLIESTHSMIMAAEESGTVVGMPA